MLTLEEPNPGDELQDAPKKEEVVETAIFNEKIKEHMRSTETYGENRKNVFTSVLGQCYDAMKAKLDGQVNSTEIPQPCKIA